jgi:co-chaperonin GroES (HSP10)
MKDRSARGLTLSDAEFEGNESGMQAIDYKVVVKKDTVEEKTEGGIYVPKEVQSQEEWNVQTGVLVSMGDLAFTDGRKPNGELIHLHPRPKVGDRVITKEFAGLRFVGDDGDPYMVFNDKEVAGVKL